MAETLASLADLAGSAGIGEHLVDGAVQSSTTSLGVAAGAERSYQSSASMRSPAP